MASKIQRIYTKEFWEKVSYKLAEKTKAAIEKNSKRSSCLMKMNVSSTHRTNRG